MDLIRRWSTLMWTGAQRAEPDRSPARRTWRSYPYNKIAFLTPFWVAFGLGFMAFGKFVSGLLVLVLAAGLLVFGRLWMALENWSMDRRQRRGHPSP